MTTKQPIKYNPSFLTQEELKTNGPGTHCGSGP
jgi:hypothetical protein